MMTVFEKIKAWPTSVKLSVLVLLMVWCLLTVAFTPFMVIFTLIGLTMASVVRVISYFTNM